jgi:hypothetical protein
VQPRQLDPAIGVPDPGRIPERGLQAWITERVGEPVWIAATWSGCSSGVGEFQLTSE